MSQPWFSDMDTRAKSDDAFPKMKYRNGVRACTLCETPGPESFKISSDENSDLPSSASEKLSTLPSSASAYSQTTENLPYTAIDNLSDLPSPTSQYPSVEVDTESSCSRILDSYSETTCINSNGYLQVTPKTRKIKSLLSNEFRS
ncbi:unnamed protein product [Larinioides sclopetarius]|uniref:Uncharacterized protein n=1 Tax=Larinioides sclopetarius TaxID=280406 RepID=A0AAV1ZUQ2_9ARAC